MTRMARRSRSLLLFVGLAACRHAAPERVHILEQKVSETGGFAAVVAASAQNAAFEVDRLGGNGRLDWKHAVDCSTINGVDVVGTTIVMRCTTSTDDHIVALSAKDGSELWRYDEKVENPRIEGRIAIFGDAVVAYGDDRFTVLDANDGKLRITYPSVLDDPWFVNGHAIGIADGKIIDVDLHTGGQAATAVAGEGCVADAAYFERSGRRLTRRPVAAIQTAPTTLIDALPQGVDRLRACSSYGADVILEFTTDAPDPAALHIVRADKAGRIVFDLKIDGMTNEPSMPMAGVLPRWLFLPMREGHETYLAKIDLEEGTLAAKRAQRFLEGTAMFVKNGNWLMTSPNAVVRYDGANGKLLPSLKFVSKRSVKPITEACWGGGSYWVFGDDWIERDNIDLLVLDDQFHPRLEKGITLELAQDTKTPDDLARQPTRQ